MIIYLVVMLVFPLQILSTEELLKEALHNSDWMKTIKGDQSVDSFEILWSEVLDTGPQELVIQTHDEYLKLQLEPSPPILDPHFALISRMNESSELLPNSLVDPSCFYRSSTERYSAALNLCNGMSGIVTSSGVNLYSINPVPENVYKHNKSSIPHVIVKRSIAKKLLRLGDDRPLPPVHVETAVFVDKDLYEHMKTNFPSNTDQQLISFILTMVNAVQFLYHDPSLGRPVSFIMKRLEILHSDPPGLQRFEDIDKFLNNFCTWQSEENPSDDSNPLHWDHALILTGLDLYVLSKNGKLSKQVVGLAPVAGMCNPTSSCTVNEGRHFESVFVVAHEIGHNLGMRHDGPLADNNCDPGSYLMSPTLGSGKITWSTCSKHYLNQFLRTPQSHCLMDHSSSSVRIDHSGGETLPGERFDADQQCTLKYGPGSKHASSKPTHEICQDLQCVKESYTWTSHPALEGTSCGVNRWCRRGRCLEKGQSVQQMYQVVKGSWSEWGPYSDCASGCLYDNNGNLEGGSTGVMFASRLCNNPRPENGGDTCVGSDRKYKTCSAQQCQKIPKTRIQTFADEICLRAREVDNQLSGTGYQKFSSDPEEACTVWCNKKSGGILSKGWTLPDGTACQTHRRHRPMYCISGVCQEFNCGDNDDDTFLLSPRDCSNSVLFSRDKRREIIVGVWQPISECYFNCVFPSRGFQLVEKRPCRYCNTTTSIKICQPDGKRCPEMRSTSEHATLICSRYREKVRRLSGVGIQLSQTRDDEDRPCKVACQDETVPNRFYLVNGEEGWFPFGTDCTKGEPTSTAYCVSGKCLRFGSDGSPLQETYGALPKLSKRQKRQTRQRKHWDPFNDTKRRTNQLEAEIVNLTHPVYVNEMDLTYKNEVDAIN